MLTVLVLQEVRPRLRPERGAVEAAGLYRRVPDPALQHDAQLHQEQGEQ